MGGFKSLFFKGYNNLGGLFFKVHDNLSSISNGFLIIINANYFIFKN